MRNSYCRLHIICQSIDRTRSIYVHKVLPLSIAHNHATQEHTKTFGLLLPRLRWYSLDYIPVVLSAVVAVGPSTHYSMDPFVRCASNDRLSLRGIDSADGSPAGAMVSSRRSEIDTFRVHLCCCCVSLPSLDRHTIAHPSA